MSRMGEYKRHYDETGENPLGFKIPNPSFSDDLEPDIPNMSETNDELDVFLAELNKTVKPENNFGDK